jgi:hypothetical protein
MAEQGAEAAQRVGDALCVADLGLVNRKAQRAQPRLVALVQAAAPDQHEVGFEFGDALEVDGMRIADDGHSSSRVGEVAVADGADECVAAADGKGEFGQVRAEADDTLGRRGEHDGAAGVVGDAHLGARYKRREGDDQREQQAHHGAGVFGSNAHCAATWHCQHNGFLATQT